MNKYVIPIQMLSLLLVSCGSDEDPGKSPETGKAKFSEENITYISEKSIRSIEDVSALVRSTTIVITSTELPTTEQRILDCPGGGTEEMIFLDHDENNTLTDGDQLSIIDNECKNTAGDISTNGEINISIRQAIGADLKIGNIIFSNYAVRQENSDVITTIINGRTSFHIVPGIRTDYFLMSSQDSVEINITTSVNSYSYSLSDFHVKRFLSRDFTDVGVSPYNYYVDISKATITHDEIDGSVSVKTLGEMNGELHSYPTSSGFQLFGDNNSSVKFIANKNEAIEAYSIEIDESGDDIFETIYLPIGWDDIIEGFWWGY